MNIKSDCLSCLLNQSLRVTKHLEVDEPTAQAMLKEAACSIASYQDITPPVAAADLYPKLAKHVGKEDLYADLKARSTQEASELLPWVREQIKSDQEPLKGAIKASVAGNVIDFATPNHFDLEEEFLKVFQTPFALSDEECFFDALSKAKRLMIVGDNVGEHLFDKLLLQEIATSYPDIQLYYAVRGLPIINDVTFKEAKEAGIDAVATLVDSGVDSAGLAYERASDDFMACYDQMDLIIAKGMGNYECLEGVGDKRIFHLFKVKCDVVASLAGVPLGSLVFVQNQA